MAKKTVDTCGGLKPIVHPKLKESASKKTTAKKTVKQAKKK